jgi:succinoglycan biosynthesis protein ExoM
VTAPMPAAPLPLPAPPIDVVVPTLRRPESLTRALRSLFAQDRAPALVAAIVVVDNSPEGCARSTVDALRPASPVPLIFVHAPEPGVATARNAGLAAGDAPLVAFLDDDEAAPPGWLAALYAAHLALGTVVTFGPVRGQAPDAAPRQRAYLDRFFSRIGPETTGVIEHPYGCGNAMMTRALALAGPAPFDTAADAAGGEDDRLFARLSTQGVRYGWAAEAWVHEYAPAHRARLGYALKRAFGYGQSPSQIAARAGRPLDVLKWMTIGAAQAALFAPLAAALLLLRHPRGAELADRAARGLGKVFWRVGLSFYGRAEIRRSDTAA